jgi:hypothetical protein
MANPFSYDCPHITPDGNGRFVVGKHNGQVLGTGDADRALALVLENLPPNCGPAIHGTAAKREVSSPLHTEPRVVRVLK